MIEFDSLCRLLSNFGVEAVAVETGARLDARYADSLRAVGRVFSLPEWSNSLLSNHPLFEGEDKIVVWGAGSLAAEMLANFFDMSAIEYFIDKDPGKMVRGRSVTSTRMRRDARRRWSPTWNRCERRVSCRPRWCSRATACRSRTTSL